MHRYFHIYTKSISVLYGGLFIIFEKCEFTNKFSRIRFYLVRLVSDNKANKVKGWKKDLKKTAQLKLM